jgi:hypothetical protein
MRVSFQKNLSANFGLTTSHFERERYDRSYAQMCASFFDALRNSAISEGTRCSTQAISRHSMFDAAKIQVYGLFFSLFPTLSEASTFR